MGKSMVRKKNRNICRKSHPHVFIVFFFLRVRWKRGVYLAADADAEEHEEEDD